MKVHTYRPDDVENAFDKRQAGFVSPLKKNRFYTGLTIFLALMLGSFFVVALATFNSKTDDRQRAATAAGVTIKFAPLSTALAVNQSMQIPIHLDTAGKAIAVAEILPSFDTTFFEAVSLTSASDTLPITQQQKTATNGQKKTRWITSLSQPDATLTGSTIVGAMYKTPGTGRLAVHECYFDGWDDYIFTTSSSATKPATFCPNTTANWKETYKGVVGYVMATKADTTLKPMQGCYDEPNNNHYYVTVENGCTAGTRTESIIGWIAPQDNSSLLTNTLVPAKVNTDGSFTSLVVAKPISIPPTGDIGSGNIAILTLKPKKAGTTTVSFNQTRTRAPEFKGAPSNIIATFQPITFTIAGDAPPPPPPPNDAQAACTQSGGTWKDLPNACVDSCSSLTGEAICAAVITPGCDCGTAKCTNASGACVINPVAPPPPPPPAALSQLPKLKNFNFELGSEPSNGWTQLSSINNELAIFSSAKYPVQPSTPNSLWYAWLGGKNNFSTEISQEIQLPADHDKLALRFDYLIASLAPNCNQGDVATIAVGSQILKTVDMCKANNTNFSSDFWRSEVLDISQMAKKLANIKFAAKTDGVDNSNFLIDNVKLCSFDMRAQEQDRCPSVRGTVVCRPPNSQNSYKIMSGTVSVSDAGGKEKTYPIADGSYAATDVRPGSMVYSRVNLPSSFQVSVEGRTVTSQSANTNTVATNGCNASFMNSNCSGISTERASQCTSSNGISGSYEYCKLPTTSFAQTGFDFVVNNCVIPLAPSGQATCTQSGGTWKDLPNACVDSCASLTEEAICAAVITPGCDCGTAKCTNSSGACVANPTAPPPPPPPPSTASASLQLQFKQQGLRKAGVTIPATVTVSYTATGSAEVIKQYSKTYTSTASGVLASSTALPLEGITLTGPIPNAQVFVKTPTSLNKKIGTVTINRGTTSLLTTAELMVGDFNQDGAQLNLFNILDISKMLTQYKMLDNPLNDTNRAFDINFDNTFNILDTSLVLSNFEALEKEGETP